MRAAAALLAALAAGPALAAPPPGAPSCSGCHGAGDVDGIPAIAGRREAELAAAMLGFRDGSKAATLMDRLMKGFTPAEIQAIAAWWAAQR